MKKFLEIVAHDLNEKLNGNFKNVSIIFNNRRPAAYLTAYLSKIVGTAFWAPKFYTIQSFFETLSNKKIASKNLQIFVLYKEMQRILQQEGINNRWTEITSFMSIGETILSDFGQIQRELINANQLFQELREISEIDAQFSSLGESQVSFLKKFWGTFSQEKQQGKQEEFIKMWRRMPLLFKNFHQSIEALGYFTEGQIYADIAQNISKNTLKEKQQLVFVGFNALSAAEVKAFKHWQDEGSAWFYFDTDTHYMNDELQEAGLFMRNNKNLYQLKNQLEWDNNLLKSDKNIKLYAAKGDTVQCTFLNNCITEIINREKASLENTAIVLLNENLLLPALQHIPENFPDSSNSIPLNISMGFSIKQNNIYNFLNNWIDLQKYYINSQQKTAYQAPHLIVQSYLWNTFSGIKVEERDAILNKIIQNQYFYVPISSLSTELFSNTNLYFEKITDSNKILPQIKLILEKALGILNQKQTIRKLEWETLKKLLDLINHVESELQLLFSHQLIDPKNLQIETVLELWHQEMDKVQIPFDVFEINSLQIVGLLETRNLDFENLIFVGANEGILPKTSKSPTFIPDSIRRAHRLPVSENLDAVSAYMFYRLIQRAKNIAIIYNSHTDENNSGEISRFIRQITFELPYKIENINPNYKLSIPKNSEIKIEKNPAIQKILDTIYTKKGISPSAFTTYLNCSLQYFYRYVASIKMPEALEEDIGPNKIGDLLHHVMHQLYAPFIQKMMHKDDLEKMHSQITQCIDENFDNLILKNQEFKPKTTGNHLVVKEVVKQYVQIILEHDKNIAPIFIMNLEEYFTFKYDLTINGNKKHVLINGFIDRIDMLENPTKKMRVVDYKTGRDILEFKNLEEMFSYTNDAYGNPNKVNLNKALIQTFIYTLMYEAKNRFGKIEPNLYLVRNMKKTPTYFIDKSDKTTKELNETSNPFYLNEFKNNFKQLFTKKLEEMLDAEKPYVQTPFIENCNYCPYLNICGR